MKNSSSVGTRTLLLLLAVTVIVLPACSGNKTHETEYLKSDLLPPLEMPPGLEAPPGNDFMEIPDLPAAAGAEGEAAVDDGRPIDAPPIILPGELSP